MPSAAGINFVYISEHLQLELQYSEFHLGSLGVYVLVKYLG